MVILAAVASSYLVMWTMPCSPCFPERTKLPPLQGCRAPDAGDGSHVEGAPIPPAQRLSARQRACRRPAGLASPKWNRLCGRLERTRQLFGVASRSHQIDHLSPELRRISGSAAGHQTPQKSTSRVSTKPGQFQLQAEDSGLNRRRIFPGQTYSRHPDGQAQLLLPQDRNATGAPRTPWRLVEQSELGPPEVARRFAF